MKEKWMVTGEMADEFSGYSADAFEMYLFGVFAQKKLLEYLIELCRKGDTTSEGNGEATIGTRGFKSMLKQLDTMNDRK